MGKFDSSIALALRLITENGQSVTLRGFTAAATPDATKPWIPGANVAVNQTVSAVFLNYAQKYIDGELIRSGDQQVLIPASGLTSPPELEGLIVRGSETWKIVAVSPLAPNDQTIMYELQVRQ